MIAFNCIPELLHLHFVQLLYKASRLFKILIFVNMLVIVFILLCDKVLLSYFSLPLFFFFFSSGLPSPLYHFYLGPIQVPFISLLILNIKTLPYQLFARSLCKESSWAVFQACKNLPLWQDWVWEFFALYSSQPTETGTARLLIEFLSFTSLQGQFISCKYNLLIWDPFPASWELGAKPDSGKPWHHSAHPFSII